MFAVHRIRLPLRGVAVRRPKRFCWGDCKDPDRREKWFMQGCSVLGGFCAASTFAICFHVPDMTLTEKAGLTAATTGWALVGMIVGEVVGQALIPLSPVVPRALGIAAVAMINRTFTVEVETKPSPELPDDSEQQEEKK